MELKEVEKIAKALSDENRLKILQYMHQNDGRMACNSICSLLHISQPSISHHVKKLLDSNLIHQHKNGRYYHYSLNKEVWDNYLNKLKRL